MKYPTMLLVGSHHFPSPDQHGIDRLQNKLRYQVSLRFPYLKVIQFSYISLIRTGLKEPYAHIGRAVIASDTRPSWFQKRKSRPRLFGFRQIRIMVETPYVRRIHSQPRIDAQFPSAESGIDNTRSFFGPILSFPIAYAYRIG